MEERMSLAIDDDSARLEALRKEQPFVEAALRQLEQILASERFQRCQENSRGFLRYVVTAYLLGRYDSIKESTINSHVFKPPKHLVAKSMPVRESARALGVRLKTYYRHEGRHDPIKITIPTGKYFPEIRDRRRAIVVSPFLNWNPTNDQGHLCSLLTEEILDRLGRDHRFVVSRANSLAGQETTALCGLQGLLICFGGDDVKLCQCPVHCRYLYAVINQMHGTAQHVIAAHDLPKWREQTAILRQRPGMDIDDSGGGLLDRAAFEKIGKADR